MSAILAANATAQAGVFYTDLGPDGITVTNDVFDLDLNHDSVLDFSLSSEDSNFRIQETTSAGTCTTNYKYWGQVVRVRGKNGSTALKGPDDPPFKPLAQRFAAGSFLDLNAPAGESLLLRGYFDVYFSSNCGPFGGENAEAIGQFSERGFLALVFEIPDSGRHAGWLDVKVDASGRGTLNFTIYRYAYEAEPGVSILAGHVDAPARIPGDTNGDQLVNLVDLNNVRNDFGARGEGIPGDANQDGVVDLVDVNAVRNNFGFGTLNPVPEPSSLVLLAAGAAGLVARRRRRERRTYV